ncbi:MAG TPA: cation-translocating P-type ATPase [Pseudobdellovibrionaceae bacterium]|nr:cation-translocating P-type ATPase [Pseudobdellovibrionaceae bacterium]
MKNSEKIHWFALSVDEVIKKINTNKEQGLSSAEVEKRRLEFGLNRIEETSHRSVLGIFLDQFKDFMILVLIAAALIAGFLGEVEDIIAILMIVVLNAILGFIQEFRAERAMEALKTLTTAKAKVLRSGKIENLSSEDLVPGDIVFVESGDLISADLRVLTGVQLQTEEATLTGESHPVNKSIELSSPQEKLENSEIPLGDRTTLLHKGTLVTHGRGSGIVVATGMQTEIGRIAALLKTNGVSKTPLQERLSRFGARLALVVIALCAVIFLIGVLRGEKPLLMFMTALSLAVAAIPEALPAVVTVLLALGARRMIKRQALIRRLPAVETLGSVTYICTDKTGTLTQNRMQVSTYVLSGKKVESPLVEIDKGNSLVELFLKAMALNNDAFFGADGVLQGDPTEKALHEAAEHLGYEKARIENEFPRIGEVPFTSERGLMTTIHKQENGKSLVFVKGAPEKLLLLCNQQLKIEGLTSLNSNQQGELLSQADQLAQEGLRVLAIAFKEGAAELSEPISEPLAMERDLTFLGFVGLSDPPRPEAKQAIENCHKASIQVVMITGDHPVTAVAIANQLGLVGPVITGQELKEMSDEKFRDVVKSIRIYARVSPEQKIKIVKALQDQGEIVSMTGDGVNDAPALKQANIGVAMGKIGTDVAREASHMILLDDHFATIVQAVREGRRIYDNIRKFIRYALATNAGEVWTLFLAPFVGLPIPFLPIHILWINFVTDGLPGIALATEKEERDVMSRPPRPPQESVFAHGLWQHALWVGLLMAALNLSIMAWALRAGVEHWQSIVFTVMTFSQMGHILAVRSEKDSLWTQGLFTNLPLLGAVVFTVILQLSVLYIPFLNSFFKTQPLSLYELLLCFALAPVIFFAVEIEKWMVRNYWIYGTKPLDLSK